MKALFTFFLVIISSTVFSQTKVFPDSIAYWREYSVGGDGSGGTVDYQDYLMLGDTIVDGKKYKNLYLHKFVKYDYRTSNGNVPSVGYNMINDRFGLSTKIGLIRKDSLKIYFRYHKNTYWWTRNDSLADKGEEYLIVDFGWDAGDTVFSENYKPGSVKYMVVKEKKNGYLTFYGSEPGQIASDYYDSNIVITGMGFNSSFFFRLRDFDTSAVAIRLHGGYSGITFFCGDNYTIIGNPNCDSIDMTISVGVNEVNKETKLTAYPNPAANLVTLAGINGENIARINISDVLGKVQTLSYTTNGEQIEADISAYPAGIYFITVQTDKSTYLCRVIKQ